MIVPGNYGDLQIVALLAHLAGMHDSENVFALDLSAVGADVSFWAAWRNAYRHSAHARLKDPRANSNPHTRAPVQRRGG
jgi:hypothetical protein